MESSGSRRVNRLSVAGGEGKDILPQKKRKGSSTEKPKKCCSKQADVLVEAEIPELPPSVNAIWRSTYGKGGRTYKPKAVKDWQKEAALIMREDFLKRGIGQYEGIVVLEIAIRTSSKRKMDVDNRIKALQDCLEPAGILNDDSQVWDLRIYRQMGNSNNVHIRLRKATEEDLCMQAA